MQSVPITSNVVSSNSSHGKLYNIMFVSDLQQVDGFLRELRFSSTNKIDHHYIAEI